VTWNYRAYGSLGEPIHKSHLNTITSDYGCLRKFRYQQDERWAGTDRDTRNTVNVKAALGTAAHETLARALTERAWTEPTGWTREDIAQVFAQELHREAGQRVIDWGSEDPTKLIPERVQMILGTLANLRQHVAEVLAIEAGFIVELGGMWLSGHVDLIYRPRDNPDGLGLADWKTGGQRPDPIELDHSWEAGVYAAAMAHGFFVGREALQLSQNPDGWTARAGDVVATHPSRYIAERNALEQLLIDMAQPDHPLEHLRVRFDRYPTEIRYVHMGDYVPYVKRGHKRVERHEDLAHWGLTTPGTVTFAPDQLRGPAWLHVRQTQEDISRLIYRLKSIVGTIRMGRFIEMIGERCKHCPYSQPCLNAGYSVTGEERKQVHRLIKQLDLGDL